MARKSRKNLDNTPAPLVIAQSAFQVGAYVRLSSVDRKQEGDSIENQQAIIQAYIAEHSDLELIDTYIDNGVSGQILERPEFQRMLYDMENGKINACISKDLSRLGRSAIDTGYYIEKYFPTHNIRYIAINDNYDSADSGSGGIMISLKNMLNEQYALEVGRKIHATTQMNIKNGFFVGGYAPYGYHKDPADIHHLIPDPYASKVVMKIFEMFDQGYGVTYILNWLNEQKIMPPRLYRYTNSGDVKLAANSNTFWTNAVISYILTNRIYCGDMVQGKSVTKQYVTKRKESADLVITPNTHEGIVSRELFAAVQSKRRKSHGCKERPTPSIFAKKLYCGHCGCAIQRDMRKNKAYTTYFCMARRYHGRDACVPVRIDGTELKRQVLVLIREQALRFTELRIPIQNKGNAPISDELKKIQQELGRTIGFLKGLYESLMDGDITNDEYTDMKFGYETKIETLKNQERVVRNKLHEKYLAESVRNLADKALCNINGIEDLTAEVIDALIERIQLFQDNHIEVKFKFTEEIASTEGIT
ncbi:MAG: recombinase family protein [Lachnospiraceae bacterium]|jgi:DNA invertase Pin-like site-specific DNA recombinase|nr:recombinase family protein [Lachnospiraceae bacterium]